MLNDLTTLARLKTWVNFVGTGTGDDAFMSQLISEVSQFCLDRIMRPTAYRMTYQETYDGVGNYRQFLRQWPVVAINSLVVSGVTIPAAPGSPPYGGYALLPDNGVPPGKPQALDLSGYCYYRALGNVSVNYDAGYCVVDEAATIPATPFQVTAVAPYGPWMQDDGVTINGVDAVKVASGTPTTGQYKVTLGVYTFALADVGKAAAISYSYVPVVLEGCALDVCAERYKYRNRIGQKSQSLGGAESVTYDNSGVTKYVDEKLKNFRRVILV